MVLIIIIKKEEDKTKFQLRIHDSLYGNHNSASKWNFPFYFPSLSFTFPESTAISNKNPQPPFPLRPIG